jgi:hypothetical protein
LVWVFVWVLVLVLVYVNPGRLLGIEVPGRDAYLVEVVREAIAVIMVDAAVAV